MNFVVLVYRADYESRLTAVCHIRSSTRMMTHIYDEYNRDKQVSSAILSTIGSFRSMHVDRFDLALTRDP